MLSHDRDSVTEDETLIAARARELYERHNLDVTLATDRLFAGLIVAEWFAAILLSVIVAPLTWAGSVSQVNQHVYLALGLGGMLTIPPVMMVTLYRGLYWNRFVVAAAQMGISGLLIHLTGGRIETHFHIFGSLAFLTFYRDWRVFVPATIVVAVDHLLRGLYFPQSVYGVLTPTIWRTVEHAAWVLYQDGFLIYFCIQIQKEMKELAYKRAAETYRAGLQSAIRRGVDELQSIHKVLQQVEGIGVQVTGATTNLAATARQQEASITQQASAATQIKATSREISANVQELVTTMDEVARGAEETANLAVQGRGLLGRMQGTMDDTSTAASSIASRFAVLNDKADKISMVITTISKVADRTNLLSLNAAIEAEKAGEHGRGFGVVATEIRRLADQTAVATLQIENSIREVQSAVASGVMGMEKFTEEVRRDAGAARSVVEQLGEIIVRVQGMSGRFEQVNYGMRSQARAAQQIAEGIGQLSEATEHSSASIHEFNSVILSLSDATQKMAATVRDYRQAT